jgi:hypothetical protein
MRTYGLTAQQAEELRLVVTGDGAKFEARAEAGLEREGMARSPLVSAWATGACAATAPPGRKTHQRAPEAQETPSRLGSNL